MAVVVNREVAAVQCLPAKVPVISFSGKAQDASSCHATASPPRTAKVLLVVNLTILLGYFSDTGF